jgi:copper resistance protein D
VNEILADPLVAVRAVHIAATLMVAGIALFEPLVAGPALDGATAAIVAASFRARMAGLMWSGLAMAVVSGVAWLLLLASRIVDRPVSEVLGDGIAWTVLTQTRFGIDWQLRLVGALLMAGCLALSRQREADSARYRNLLAIASAAVAGTLAWSGHGGARPGIPGDFHLAADVLHLIAASAWIGGLVPLACLLALLRRSHAGAAMPVAHEITQRFSNLGIGAVAAILASGTVNAWFLAGSTQALAATHYGHLLLVKIALFAVMICIAAANRQILLPKLSMSRQVPDQGPRAMRQLQRNVALEIVLGLVIVAIVAALGITPPGIEAHAHVH